MKSCIQRQKGSKKIIKDVNATVAFTTDAKSKTGYSKRTIETDIQIADNLSDEVIDYA